MKHLFSAGVLFFLGALCAHAGEVTSQAVVLKMAGRSQATMVDGAAPVALKVGEKLPEGATIVTSPSGQVVIQAFNGAEATIMEGSTLQLEKLSVTTADGAVTSQTAILFLKDGKVSSEINPANHKINHYAIRTPTTVAAARGTKYVTVYSAATHTSYVFVIQGVVAAGGVNVEAGQVAAIGPTGHASEVPLTSLPAAVQQAIQQAVAQVTGGNGNGSSNTNSNNSNSNSIDPSINNNNNSGNTTTQSPAT